MSLAGCQINPIDVNFYLQKSLEIFYKNSAAKNLNQKGQGVDSALPHANYGLSTQVLSD
jgi:hypothetical protein